MSKETVNSEIFNESVLQVFLKNWGVGVEKKRIQKSKAGMLLQGKGYQLFLMTKMMKMYLCLASKRKK